MIHAVNHITLTVTDIEKFIYFYKNVLGFKPLVKGDKVAYFWWAAGKTPFGFALMWIKIAPPNPCYTHYAFSVNQESFNSFSQKMTASETPVF